VAPRGAHPVQWVQRQHQQVLVPQPAGGGAAGHERAQWAGGSRRAGADGGADFGERRAEQRGRGGRVPRRDGGGEANGTRGGAGGVPGVRTGSAQAAAAGAAAGRAAKRAAAGAAACAAPGRAEGRPPAGAAAGPPAGRAAGRAAGPSAGPRAGGEEAEEGTAGVVMFPSLSLSPNRASNRVRSNRPPLAIVRIGSRRLPCPRAIAYFLSIREAAGVARLVSSRKRRRRRRLGREGNGANGRVRDVHGGDCRMSFTGYATTRLPSGRRS